MEFIEKKLLSLCLAQQASELAALLYIIKVELGKLPALGSLVLKELDFDLVSLRRRLCGFT